MLTLNTLPKPLVDFVLKKQLIRKTHLAYIESQFSDTLAKIFASFPTLTTKDICLSIRYNIELQDHTCTICGRKVRFNNRTHQWNTYCSGNCARSDPNMYKRREETCLKKYGVRHVTMTKEHKQKVKKTVREKYGVDYISQLEDVKLLAKQKRQQTLYENYGVTVPLHLEAFKNKAKQTNIKKYGQEHAMKNANISNKCKNTTRERYGTDCIFTSQYFKDQSQRTCLEKYGCTRAIHDSKVQCRIRESQFIRYWKEFTKHISNKHCRIIPKFDYTEYRCKNGFGYKNLYRWKCKECGHEFIAYYSNGRLPVCRHCHPYSISKGQLEVINYIKEITNTELRVNDKTVIGPYELDIYLPKFNLAVEYNGEYWHKQREKGYHQFKLDLCKEKNIKLVYIWDSKWMGKYKNKYQQILHKLLTVV